MPKQTEMSAAQSLALTLLRIRSRSLTELANSMRTNRLVASSVLRALERRGLVAYAPPLGEVDQWSRGNWHTTEESK